MTVKDALADAIKRARPGTTPFHTNRIAGNFAAALRSELRWMDIYEDKPQREYGE